MNNLRDIRSERRGLKGKYRHVSHADFHKKLDTGKKMRDITSEVGILVVDS